MSVGNLKTNGNKGNNFPFQLGALQLLGLIEAGITGLVPPGGLATEATALSILAAIQNGRDFEQNLVIDTGGVGCPANCPTYSEIRIWNGTSFDPPVYYNAAGAVVVPVGPLEYVNPQFTLEDILQQLVAANALLTTIDGDTSTLSAPQTGLPPVMIRSSAAGTVAAGKRSIAFFNAGNADATVTGAVLKPGETVSFSADGLRDTLAAASYDGTGTDLLITTVG